MSLWFYCLCGKSYLTDKVAFYKITLKNGESININTIISQPTIYFEQENNYSLSYSTDGEHFIDYKNDKNITLSETMMGEITFTSSGDYTQPGTIILRRSDGSTPDYTGPADSGTSFPDVSKNADYAAAVEYVGKLGVMVGDEKGNFNPDKIVSRAEMATIVCRVLGQTENLPQSNVFSDVPAAHWANAFIGKASELKIVVGYDGRFSPSEPVTCEQATTMIVRTIGAEDEAISYGGYPDGYWYVALQKNLLKGVWYQQGQGMSRSAVAVLLYNYYTADPGIAGGGHTHSWATRHVDEVGHYEESSGTHQVEARRCDCGFRVDIAGTTDTENIAIWNNHKTTCTKSHIYWIKDVPNEPQYIIDTPAHDETYCTICGAIQ